MPMFVCNNIPNVSSEKAAAAQIWISYILFNYLCIYVYIYVSRPVKPHENLNVRNFDSC